MKYVYTATGEKLQARYGENNVLTYNGSVVRDGNSSLKYILTGEGRYVMNGVTGTAEYHLADHLGNVRVVLGSTGSVLQRNDYYPFGLLMAQEGSSTNRYLYNGKEEQELTGWLDYGARMYDAAVGRWFNVDPMAESYYSLSSYNYCANNPILFINPDGQALDWYRNPAGEIKYDPSIHSAKDMKKKGIEGSYLGKTYTEGDTYYSLFGHIKNLKNWEGRLFQKIDEVLILNANYIKRMYKYNNDPDIFKMEPLERSVNFDIGIPFKRNIWGLAENNLYTFKYEGSTGYYFLNEAPNGMYGKFDRGDDKYTHTKAISNMGLKSGYNMYIRKKENLRSSIVVFVFPTLESKNKFYKKWQEEFFYSK